MFNRHGLRASLENTEVTWLGRRKTYLKIPLNGTVLVVYLGGAICEDGN